MREVDELRPSGIKRKLIVSPLIDTAAATGTDYPVAHFPHGAKLLSLKTCPVSALSANASSTTLDLGVAADGDTVIDGFALTDSQAIGVVAEMINTPGTNGGLKVIPVNTTIFCEVVLQDADGGKLVIIVEYEDQNN